MSEGVGTGIGIGIGEGLHHVADNLRAHYERQRQDRDRQATALHQQAHDYYINKVGPALDAKGYKIGKQATGQWGLIDQSGQPVQDPNIQPLVDTYLGTFNKYRDVFKNDPNAMMQHFRSAFGKPPAQATFDKRADEITPETVAGEAPPDKSLAEMNTIRQQIDATYPNATPQEKAAYFTQAMSKKLGTEPEKWTPTKLAPFAVSGDPNRREGVYHQVEQTKDGKTHTATELMPGVPKSAVETATPEKAPVVHIEDGQPVITDPKTGKVYGTWNINDPDTPPEFKRMHAGLVQSAAEAEQRKEAAADKRAEQSDERQLRSQTFAQEQQQRSFTNQTTQKETSANIAEWKKADDAANLNKVEDELSSQRLKKLDSVNSQGLIMGWVRTQVAGAGRMNTTEIQQLLKSGNVPERITRAWDMATKGTLPPDFAKQIANDIHTSYVAKRKIADELKTPQGAAAASPAGNGDPDMDFINSLNK